METVKAAIERDGLALARVPPNIEAELTKFGGTDPIHMLKFRAAGFPADTSSCRILDICILSILQLLDRRVRLSEDKLFATRDGPVISGHEVNEVNVYRDILLTLIRRFYTSFNEVIVSRYQTLLILDSYFVGHSYVLLRSASILQLQERFLDSC